MEDTKLKIEEANYFLSQMRKKSRGSKTFNFYLNSFVSSARSITWILKSELSNSENLQKLYNSKTLLKEEKLLLNYLNDLRIESVKIKPLTTSNQIEIDIPPKEVINDLLNKAEELVGKKSILMITNEKDEIEKLKKKSDSSAIFARAYLNNFIVKVNNLGEDTDIIDASVNYLNLLKKLVDECEQKICT